MGMEHTLKQGGFTLPGEAGYEELTLQMAKKWGADVIRDSDGTQLSDEIIHAGYDIYSTICLIRSDNAWAKQNMDKLQQNFLMSEPVYAKGDTVTIDPLKGYFTQQFAVNWKDEPKEFWQVFDRTAGTEVPAGNWDYDEQAGTVTVRGCVPYHKYTVNFLAIRLWEEISMYNHITNDWGDKEHLMAVEPRHPETQAQILKWLEQWCKDHPMTNVVRFTSMFYNFTWIWTDHEKRRDDFTDWGSYDFTVNPIALREFEKAKGYKMTSEDFINRDLHNATHNAPSRKYRDWMDFVNQFVVEFGKKCVDIVHRYGKKAYVFYDDSWVGVEPYGERFKEFGFDGLIKCVFNGFEARLCAGVKDVQVHELRLHPYLFPTGLGGAPTFMEGGNPTLDAKRYWGNVRRAILRASIDRIGLGGYLSLTQKFPDFQDYIAQVADEFRLLKSFHQGGKPYCLPVKVAVLTSWGKLRSWSCSGHYHEHPELDLINLIEALSGLPIDVEFVSLDEVREKGVPAGVDVLINAGRLNTAWSGGEAWKDAKLLEEINRFVANGGGFIGVNEPAAQDFSTQFIQVADVLGVDIDLGTRICHGRYQYEVEKSHYITADTAAADSILGKDGVYLLNDQVQVLLEKEGAPALTANQFGQGRGVYMAGFRYSLESARLLMRAICWAAGKEDAADTFVCDNLYTECAYYPDTKNLVIINNAEEPQDCAVKTPSGDVVKAQLPAFEIKIVSLA